MTSVAPSITSLSLHDIFINISNAFIGTMADLWYKEDDVSQTNDPTLRTLMKENRYMYLALLLLGIIMLANIFFD